MYLAAILVLKNVINKFYTLGNLLLQPKVNKIGQTGAEIRVSIVVYCSAFLWAGPFVLQKGAGTPMGANYLIVN